MPGSSRYIWPTGNPDLSLRTAYGDKVAIKNSRSIRHVFGNIQGLAQNTYGEKDAMTWQTLSELQADHAGLTELNQNMIACPTEYRLYE